MILKRENYTELPLWRWFQLRAILAWTRLSGGFTRALGLEREALNLTTIGERALSRAVPALAAAPDARELALAASACPTRAIRSRSGAWEIEAQRCVRCGLCYVCAPQSLVPAAGSTVTVYAPAVPEARA